jgi:hypothetical protein
MMFKSVLAISLTAATALAKAVPANSAYQFISPLSDGTVNATAIETTDPSVYFTVYSATSCGGAFTNWLVPDGHCIGLDAGSLKLHQFYGNCRFSKYPKLSLLYYSKI